MATTEAVFFIGGPCDGQTKQVPVSVVQAGTITCGGTAYVVDESQATQQHPIAAAVKGGGPSAGTKAASLHVTQAWSRWMHALAHTGPASHKRIVKATARARRIAR